MKIWFTLVLLISSLLLFGICAEILISNIENDIATKIIQELP